MAVLQFVWSYGLWLSVPVFCLGIGMLVSCARTFFRVQGVPELARAPLADRQTVPFDKMGRIIMRVEGIPVNPRPLRLSYHLIAEDGTFVASRPMMTGFTNTAFTGLLHPQRVYDIPQAGNYTLMVRGLEDSRQASGGCCVVFESVAVYGLYLSLLGMMFSVGLVVGGLALFLMKLLGVE